MFNKTLEYIHQNPAYRLAGPGQVGFVVKPEDWKYAVPEISAGKG